MAERYVALFRGINVGRAKRVAMADLRALAGRLGYEDCRTLLNSGNLVFRAAGAAQAIAAKLQRTVASELGVESRVMVLSGREWTEVVAGNRLGATANEPSRTLVAFVPEARDLDKLVPLRKLSWEPEILAVGSRAAYLWCPDGIAESALVEAVGRALGDRLTIRNWATVLKVQAVL